MEIVALVYDWKITKTELDFEENRVKSLYPGSGSSEIKAFAMNELVNRYLLMQEAINHGISITDEEFEEAMFNLLDHIENPDTSVLLNRMDRGEQIERVLKSNLIINKYIQSLDLLSKNNTEDKLYKLYQERQDFFCKKEEVRASHILIKGNDEAARLRIQSIRDSIHTVNDFISLSMCDSQCPSGLNCGDLGYFPRGRMIPEMENVAFSMNLNEISQPFQTKYGYHILMVTDKKTEQIISFEEIKDYLCESLRVIEEEITRTRILAEIRERSKDEIQIFNHAFE